MLRRLYEWMLAVAERPYAPWILGAVSFAESSFFPMPPDVMLLPMALARPDRAWRYALLCTLTSVAGGLLGYGIGALLYDTLGHWLIRVYGFEGGIETVRAYYAEYGAWFILLKGLTPIPYKLVTIVSGFAGYDIVWFTILSLITRGARFAILAVLLHRYGEQLKAMIDRHLGLAAFLLVALVVGGFAAIRLLH